MGFEFYRESLHVHFVVVRSLREREISGTSPEFLPVWKDDLNVLRKPLPDLSLIWSPHRKYFPLTGNHCVCWYLAFDGASVHCYENMMQRRRLHFIKRHVVARC